MSGLSQDDLRKAMRKRFTSVTMNEWCRLAGVSKSHMSEFLAGKRGPCNDLLRALNLEVRYVKKRSTTSTTKEPQP